MHNLAQELAAAVTPRAPRISVTWQQYAQWLTHCTWHRLQGLTWGQSFCKHFRIRDNILGSLRTAQGADRYIRNHYMQSGRARGPRHGCP